MALFSIVCLNFQGEYLALTGARLSGPEMVHCGLATHYVPLKVCYCDKSASIVFLVPLCFLHITCRVL